MFFWSRSNTGTECTKCSRTTFLMAARRAPPWRSRPCRVTRWWRSIASPLSLSRALTGESLGLMKPSAGPIDSHRSLQRHAELGSLFLQPRVELLDHLPGPLVVDLTGRVFAFAQHRVTPVVDQMIHFRIVGYFSRQLRRNESDALRIADRNVARHHGCISDSDRHVDSSQHDVLERRGIDAARVHLEARNFLNAGDISHRSVHDQSVATLGVNGGREIIADDGAVADFPEQIDDQNVTRLQDVDDPGVLVSNAIFFSAVGLNHGIHVRASRHENGGHDPAHEALPGIA